VGDAPSGPSRPSRCVRESDRGGGQGDKVVSRNTVTGTHQGEYRGLPPTGKSITYNEIFIFRFVGGRIAEIWGVVDVFSQMKQLGVIPA
jgi:predicted ester cyclase